MIIRIVIIRKTVFFIVKNLREYMHRRKDSPLKGIHLALQKTNLFLLMDG